MSMYNNIRARLLEQQQLDQQQQRHPRQKLGSTDEEATTTGDSGNSGTLPQDSYDLSMDIPQIVSDSRNRGPHNRRRVRIFGATHIFPRQLLFIHRNFVEFKTS